MVDKLPYWRTEKFLREHGFDVTKITVFGFDALGYSEFVYDKNAKRVIDPNHPDRALTVQFSWPEGFPVAEVLNLYAEDRRENGDRYL